MTNLQPPAAKARPSIRADRRPAPASPAADPAPPAPASPDPVMVERIVDLVERQDHVTFAALASDVPGFGGGGVDLAGGTDVLLWRDLTPAGAASITKVLDEGLVSIARSDPLAYAFDGEVPALPVVGCGRWPDGLAWLPICLRPARHANDRLARGWLNVDGRRPRATGGEGDAP